MAKRKMSENSLKNLKPIQKGELSKEELKKRQSNGGKKSAQVQRENKLLSKVAEEKLNKLYSDGKTFQEKSLDLMEGMILTGILKPDDLVKLLTFLRDTAGQKPTDKQEITTNQPAVNLTINKADIKEIANDINDLADE